MALNRQRPMGGDEMHKVHPRLHSCPLGALCAASLIALLIFLCVLLLIG